MTDRPRGPAQRGSGWTGLVVLAFFACQWPLAANPKAEGVVIILMDDVGGEHLDFHPMGEGTAELAHTPRLTAFADRGLSFINAWATPRCSPTRAALLTGRFGHRTGVGENFGVGLMGGTLPLSEVTLAERLDVRGVSSALFGKWHLSRSSEGPCDQGFDVWRAGSLGNLGGGKLCTPCGYSRWERIDDDQGPAAVRLETGYATEVITNEALRWIKAQDGPWFALVSYQAAHMPIHAPPAHLQPLTGATDESSLSSRYHAMIEALDTEIGRLVDQLDLERTTVIIMGDNGSAERLAQIPNDLEMAKGTVYRGGIEVPLIVLGNRVDRSVEKGDNSRGQRLAGPVNVVDLFPTVLGILSGEESAGAWPEIDGSTFLGPSGWRSGREWNFTELFKPRARSVGGTNYCRAVEQGDYKLLTWEDGTMELYDVESDPWETHELLGDGVAAVEAAAVEQLTGRLELLGLKP